jgi:hypothetical protein
MKANLLSFIFIFFSESGLFNGLRGKKYKNFASARLARQVVGQRFKQPQFLVFPPATDEWDEILSTEMRSADF